MFAAGGIATPADAALMMQLGCDGVFVGSGIVSIHVEQMRSDTPANRTLIIPTSYVTPQFASGDPVKRAKAIVQATTHFNNPKVLADISCGLGEAMSGVDVADNMPGGRMAGKGN